MEEELNLVQKLAKIRKMTEVIQKNRKGYGYKYVSVDEILAKVTAGMNKYGVSLVPQIVPGSEEIQPNEYSKTKFDKDGNAYEDVTREFSVCAQMIYTWVNDDNPKETIEVPWLLVGNQSTMSQAFGSGLTYSMRYFLMQYFQIAALDSEDPDAWRTKQKEAEAEEDRLVAEKIIDQVHALVTEHLAKVPDDRKKLTEIIKKYARENGKATANYYAIETPATATELLNALQSAFDDKTTTKE